MTIYVYGMYIFVYIRMYLLLLPSKFFENIFKLIKYTLHLIIDIFKDERTHILNQIYFKVSVDVEFKN